MCNCIPDLSLELYIHISNCFQTILLPTKVDLIILSRYLEMCVFILLNFILFKMVNTIVDVYILCLLLLLMTPIHFSRPISSYLLCSTFLIPSKRVFFFPISAPIMLSNSCTNSNYHILLICSVVYFLTIYFHSFYILCSWHSISPY